MKNITLKGPRITLRPVKLSDAPAFLRWFRDKKVIKYLLSQNQWALSLEQEQKYLRARFKDKNLYFRSVENEDGELIGNTRISLNTNDRRATFGIVIGEKSQWGKGYAGEILNLWKEFVFEKLKYNRLELIVQMNNTSAVHAYKKAGFVLEGVQRKCAWNLVTKKFEDDGIMSILRSEWLKKKK